MQARVENGAAMQTDVNRLELLAENLAYNRLKVESAREIVGRDLANALGMGTEIPVVSDVLPETAVNSDWTEEALALIALSHFKRQIYSTVPLLESIFMAAVIKWNIAAFRKSRAGNIP